MMNESSPSGFAGFIERIKKWTAPFVAIGVFVFGLRTVFEEGLKNLAWLLVAIAIVGWLFLYWIYTSKIKRETQESVDTMPRTEVLPEFPKGRQWALVGMILLPLITISGFAVAKYNESRPSKKILVLVANFQGPEQKHLVTPTVIDKLREAINSFSEVEIQPLKDEITGQDGSEVARAKGKEKKASIVIWGFYDEALNATMHIEIVSEREVLSRVMGTREAKTSYSVPTTASNPSLIVKERISGDMGLITLLLLGSIRYEVKDFDGAILRFSKAIQQRTSAQIAGYQSRLFLLRGRAYDAKGEKDRAIEDYNKAIELDPKDMLAYLSRGIVYDDKGEIDSAIEDYSKAIELDPEDSNAYALRGRLYYDKGEIDSAIEDYSKTIELDPKDSDAYFNRGRLYDDKGEIDSAIEDYSKAIELAPKDEITYLRRGIAYSHKGEKDRAIEDYNKAIELDPKDMLAYAFRGIAYSDKGEKDSAIKDYNKVIELDPKDADAYYHRGLAYSDKGEKVLAIADFQKSLKLFTNPKNRAKILQQLRKLGAKKSAQ